MGEMIKIGMADLKVCTAPNVLTTLGLGSCVGIVLYDSFSKTAGMVHVMLPDSTKIKNSENAAKFADTGIDALILRLAAIGANRSRLIAKIAGGAQMFAFTSDNDMLRIGERNTEASKLKLQSLGIHIVAEDTGLNYGRTLEFYPETGELYIKSVGRPLKIM